MGSGGSKKNEAGTPRRLSLTHSPPASPKYHHQRAHPHYNDFDEQQNWSPQPTRPKYKAEISREQNLSQSLVSLRKGVIRGGEVVDEKLQKKRMEWEEATAKRIHVVVRTRPLNVNEIRNNSKDVVYMDEINNECTILVPKPRKAMAAASGGNPNKSVTFSFDRCYNGTTNSAQIYNEIPYSLVQSVLEGYNATVMAYGQTGSGKSFTMQEDPDHIGIIPRAIVHVFEGKESDEDADTQYFIHVSYVEIYNEEIRDLLSENPERKLEIKGNNVQDLTMHYVESIGHCAELLSAGIKRRITSATTMNLHSSRSHAIFTVWIKVVYTDPSGHKHYRKGKLNLVDLAGSERHGKTGITNESGQTFTESKSINLSLSTLGKVIQCLSSDKPGHIPYRESKLTRLLQDSLGGNARTLMIACMSPSDLNFEESLSTLKYAHNTKFINNRPVVNEELDPKEELIKELQNEIKTLRYRLKE